MRGLFPGWGAAALAAVIALAQTAPAQAQDVDPLACVRAYTAASTLHAHLTGSAAEGKTFPSLGALTDRWSEMRAYTYTERAGGVVRQTEQAGDGLLLGTGRARTEGTELGDALFLESASTGLNALLQPEAVFAGQRQLFAELRTCDQAYGFDPVLGVPPAHDAVIALLERQEQALEAQLEARRERLAAFDDKQCAARFYILGMLAADNPQVQRALEQKMGGAMRRASEAGNGLAMERLQELVQREITQRGAEMRTPEDLDPLLEEVNACERKYGVPLTTRNSG